MSVSFTTTASHVSEHDETSNLPKLEPSLDLEDLLQRALELWDRFPPSSVGSLDIFGPNSATRTWALESTTLSDEEAEQIVREERDIVYPETPERIVRGRRRTLWAVLCSNKRTLVLVGALASVLLAVYGPRWQNIRKWARPWVSVAIEKFRYSNCDGCHI